VRGPGGFTAGRFLLPNIVAVAAAVTGAVALKLEPRQFTSDGRDRECGYLAKK
jgi:hypothetical protein